MICCIAMLDCPNPMMGVSPICGTGGTEPGATPLLLLYCMPPCKVRKRTVNVS